MKPYSLKALYPDPVQRVFGEIHKIASMKYFLNKIADVQYTFASSRLYHS